MTERMESADFKQRVLSARAEWAALVRAVPAEEMLQPGFCGDWSLKDVLAHISWYEREMVGLLETRVFGGSPLWELPTPERNAAIQREIVDLELEQVLREAQEVFARLLGLIGALTDDDLNDPARFPGMPAQWRPWQVLAGSTYEHYLGHAPHARAWRERSGDREADPGNPD